MNKKYRALYLIIAAFLIILISFLVYNQKSTTVGEFDNLVNCLAEKDVKFYGAYWCGHCNTQKKLFKDSLNLLKEKVYIECAEDAFDSQRELCIQAEIEGYPTWIINGQKYPGTKSLNKLSELTDCEL